MSIEEEIFKQKNVRKGKEGNCGGKPRIRGTKNGQCRSFTESLLPSMGWKTSKI